MSQIYYKVTGSHIGTGMGRNCLILEPRELLLYPFDLGTGWARIAVGMYYDWIGVSGENSPFSSESIINWSQNSPPVTFRPYNNFLFGLTNKESPFPLTENNIYIGSCSSQSQDNFNIGSSLLSNFSFNVFSGSSFQQIQLQNHYISEFGVTGYTGDTVLKTIFWGFELGIDRNTNFISGKLLGSQNYDSITRHSLKDLSVDLNSFPGSYNTTYLTHNYSSTGYKWNKIPDALAIYSPFYYNRIRIYNIGVFRIE